MKSTVILSLKKNVVLVLPPSLGLSSPQKPYCPHEVNSGFEHQECCSATLTCTWSQSPKALLSPISPKSTSNFCISNQHKRCNSEGHSQSSVPMRDVQPIVVLSLNHVVTPPF